MTDDVRFMRLALEEAKRAAALGETPIGAVVVSGGEVIATAHNSRERNNDITAHAELLAIRQAAEQRGDWRLGDCTVYVTLEPCPMCAGALINSRIDRVVYGVEDAKAGCLGSVINFNSYPFNHAFSVTSGVCAKECANILSDFFAAKRSEIKNKNNF